MATSKKAPTKAAAADLSPAPAAVAAKVAKPKAPAKTTATAKAAPKTAVAPAVPVAKKVAVKTVATKSAPTAQPKKKAGVEGHTIDAQQRANYIEVAAFYIAERRGFAPGNPEQDYLDAAAEIDRMVVAGHFAK